MGKTNILDAIYYLSYCKSFFNATDSYNINYEEDFFVLQGDYLLGEKQESFHCGVKRGGKKVFKRNKKLYERLADHISVLPLVMISPSDSQLIHEGGEERRRYLNGVISQFDPSYLSALMTYNKLLRQRNALLKQFAGEHYFDAMVLEPWDAKLIEQGLLIHEKRLDFIQKLSPLFQQYHENITGSVEPVSLEYDSALTGADFAKLLQSALKKDLAIGFTTQGIHRDDLIMKLRGYPLKRGGSQGQNKSFLVALKLAQFDLIRQVGGQTPILLLDDVFDKLDSKRVEQIVHLVSDNHFGQIFITDTNRQHLRSILEQINREHRIFEVHQGNVKNSLT